MSDATVFYILAGVLAASAVIVSFLGIKVEKFPGKAGPVVVLVFIAIVGAATTFAVLNGQHEEEVRAAELEEAGEEFEEEESDPLETPAPEQGSKAAGGGEKAVAKGPGGTVKLSASPTDLAYDTDALASKPGEVTIDFENPAAIDHDVAIEANGSEIGKTDLIAEGETSVTEELEPGTYTFFCSVPGHREAGMEGTLTVK